MYIEKTSEDYLSMEGNHLRASTGKRLANYLIDMVVFYMFAFIIGLLLAIVSPSSTNFLTDDSAGFGLLEKLLSLIFYAVYMSVIEAVFNGKSLGKLITKTRAVNLDGSEISASTAFARGFSRAVPFCVFSAFGNHCDPWHDRWTDTMVIEEHSM